ncbi:DNA binding domain, excisionase family [Rikenella microfusus]|uniref:DNA binding domain, excisionase family n=2 Tax=Rikenella microfusus TaxID=28139 RepID=A0A379MU87_9BACT|nr:DNA binding domain, excisionase family [Rikenella microfusus]
MYADEIINLVCIVLQGFIELVRSMLNDQKNHNMGKDQLTFNDLPTVVGELYNRIASMENLLTEKLSKQHEAKENTHVPMTVQEACAYLKMPLSTFYYKVKKDDIPVIKQGKHLYIYRDELDRWLESSRKNPAPQSFEEENEAMLASHRRKPNPKNW